MNLEINKNLFAVWCGMIISGYDLCDNNDKKILYLCNEIKDKLYNDEIAKYFAFYMDKQIDEYYRFLEYCGDTEHRNIEFQEWIEKGKYYINKIIENDSFSELFDNYIIVLNKRFNDINNQISSIKNKLDKNNLLTDIEIIFAPNLLQSKYLADYVLINNKLYIIAADFSKKTVIHEYLHIIANSKHHEFEKLLKKRNINDLIDVSEMQTLGYLKDFSLESKTHTLEEQFVRYYTNLLT